MILQQEELGQVSIFCFMDEADQDKIHELGLQAEGLSLQKLFVLLTEGGNDVHQSDKVLIRVMRKNGSGAWESFF